MEFLNVGVVLAAGKPDVLFGFGNTTLQDHGANYGIFREHRPTSEDDWFHAWLYELIRLTLRSLLRKAIWRYDCPVVYEVVVADEPGEVFTMQEDGGVPYLRACRIYLFVRFRDHLEPLRVSKKTPFFRNRIEPAVVSLVDLLPKSWPTHSLVECVLSVLRNPATRIPPWKIKAFLPDELVAHILAFPDKS